MEEKRDISAFRALCLEHSEDMVILAYLLLDNADCANQVVEKVLGEVWDKGDFERLDTASLFLKVRASCSEVISSYV